MSRARIRHVFVRLALASTFLVIAPCTNIYDLCPPLEVTRPFFSRGDCTVTRGELFAGHEWITDFAIQDLPAEARFSDDDAALIMDGNRRVDWPRELLIQLNVGLHAYIAAILEYTDDPTLQRDHFLLSDRDTYAEATAKAHDRLHALSQMAVEEWAENRRRALTQTGAALHLIQDSYSEAHTVREDVSGCVIKVKAYIARADGFLTDDIEFHGGRDGDDIGHSSAEDSIFNGSDACRTAEGPEEVRGCLRESAEAARSASTDYLALLLSWADRGAGWDATAEAELDDYIAARLSLCPE